MVKKKVDSEFVLVPDNSTVKNLYKDLPVVGYKKTTVAIPTLHEYARTLINNYGIDVVRMSLAMFLYESASGQKGVNNNYGGVQADNARWSFVPIAPVATTVLIDSGKVRRRFLVWFQEDGYKCCLWMKCHYVTRRKIKTAGDYFKSWVGNPNPTPAHLRNFKTVLASCQAFK